MISTVEVLKLMEAFVNEPNYTVWSDLSCNLGVLSSLLSHTDFHEEIQEFIRDLFTPIGLKLGWDSKPGEGEGGSDLLDPSRLRFMQYYKSKSYRITIYRKIYDS